MRFALGVSASGDEVPRGLRWSRPAVSSPIPAEASLSADDQADASGPALLANAPRLAAHVETTAADQIPELPNPAGDPADQWLPDPDSMDEAAEADPEDEEPVYTDSEPSEFERAVADEPPLEEAYAQPEPIGPAHGTPLRSHLARQRQLAWPRFHQPLTGETWLRRPWSASYFMGGMFGDALIPDQVDQHQGFFTGGRLGWDFDLHWGTEARLGFASIGLVTNPVAPGTDRSNNWVFDTSLLYYPMGDNRWRPYFQVGVGLFDVLYYDANRSKLHETLFSLPFGGGIKYRWSDRVVMRFDVLDNLAFAASKTATINNLSISLGLEWRFGGPRRSYWPWEPGSLYW